MRIVCIGGGPAGLYFSLLMKLQDRRHEVTVYERNRPDDTFGCGVVFYDETLDNLVRADGPWAEDVHTAFAHWGDIDVHSGSGSSAPAATASPASRAGGS